MAHTKGPWELKKSIKKPIYTHIGNYNWQKLARVVTRMHGATLDSEEGLANAALIAAAPELFEALKILVYLDFCKQEGIASLKPTCKQWTDAFDNANEVIKKAITI